MRWSWSLTFFGAEMIEAFGSKRVGFFLGLCKRRMMEWWVDGRETGFYFLYVLMGISGFCLV